MLSWNEFSKVRKDMTTLPSRNLIENTDMPSLSDKSFFPLSLDNFWLHTIHINFFCNVTRGEHKNGAFFKINAQPYQQILFWPLSTTKIWFVKLNWISDKRDFRIYQHFFYLSHPCLVSLMMFLSFTDKSWWHHFSPDTS